MRIVFMGTPLFAVPPLRALLHSPHEVVAVVTQEDSPQGRGLRLTPPPVKVAAQEAGMAVLQPQRLKKTPFPQTLRDLRPDCIVVAAYGKILRSWLLTLPRLGCINIHPSLLPRHRGAAPIQWTLIRGDEQTAVTIMQMNEGMDTGDMLLQRTYPVLPDDTAGTLHDRLSELSGPLLLEALEGLDKGTIVAVPQDEGQATLAPRLTTEMARLPWEEDAASLVNLIRGTNPAPGAWTTLEGQRLKIWRATVSALAADAPPGTILASPPGSLVVACGQGGLEIRQLQPPGKRPMEAKAFLSGRAVAPGVRLI